MYPEKPILDLSNIDSNVFSIIGAGKAMLKKYYYPPEKVKEFFDSCFAAGSYNNVLYIIQEWFDVRTAEESDLEIDDDPWFDDEEEYEDDYEETA